MTEGPIRRLASEGGRYFLGHLFLRGLAAILTPILTRVLTPEEYGLLGMLAVVRFVLFPLFHLGLGEALPRGVLVRGEETPNGDPRAAAFWGVVAPLAVGGGGAAAAWAFASPLASALFGRADAAEVLALGMTLVAFETSAHAALALLRADGRAGTFSALVVARSVLAIVLVLSALAAGGRVAGVLAAEVAAEGAMLFAVLGLIRARLRPRRPDARTRALFAFALPFVPLPMIQAGFVMGERLALRVFVPGALEVIGRYAVAFAYASLFNFLVVTPLRFAWPPIFYTLSNEARANFARRLFRAYALGGGLVAGLMALFAREVLWIFVGSNFRSAEVFVPFLLLAFYLRGAADMGDAGIHATGRSSRLLLPACLAALFHLASSCVAVASAPGATAAGVAAAGVAAASSLLYLVGVLRAAGSLFPVPGLVRGAWPGFVLCGLFVVLAALRAEGVFPW